MEFRKFQEPEKIKVELRNPSAGARRKFQISRVRPYARPLVRPIVRSSSLPVAVTLPVVALRLASPVRPRCGLMWDVASVSKVPTFKIPPATAAMAAAAATVSALAAAAVTA